MWYETAYVHVFEYDFWYFGGEPTNLLFHNLSPYYGNPFTGDLEFVEGALYGYKGNGVVTQAIPDPEIVPEIPTLTGTFYVADTDGWIAPGSEIRQWYNYNLMIGMNDQEWPNVNYTHDTSFKDKYVEINGRWYPIYKFDLTSGSGKVWNIHNVSRFASPYGRLNEEYVRDADGNMVYDDNGYPKMEYKFVEPLEGLLPKYEDRTADDAMGQVAPGVWKFTVDDIAGYDDVLFYYYTLEDPELVVHPASRSRYFNPIEWDGYVFDIGTDCVHQSYLTVDEYESLRQKDLKEASTLYLAGSSAMSGLTGQDGPIKSVPVEADHGCFFYEFDVTDESAASFKISTMDVAGIVGRKDLADHYSFQRGWATFNLGIIGFQNDPGDADWYDKYIYAPGNGQSRQARLWLNESVDFNSSTQYPWRLGDGENGVTEGDYWLVIDLHDEDHSLTLLDFDPNPTSEIANKGFSVAEVGYDYALSLDNTDPHKGEAANGKVGFDRVNVLSANAEVTGRSADFLKERDFTVAYTAYVGDVAVATLDIPEDGDFESGVMEIPYMAPGELADVSVRAHYTDTNTRRSFCSRKNHKELTAPMPVLSSPQTASVDGSMHLYFASRQDEESLTMTVGGAATVPYQLEEETPYVYYPDYSVEEVNTDGVDAPTDNILVSSGHWMASREPFANHLGEYSDTPWIPVSDDMEYGDSNNWSKYVASEGHLPIFINALTTVDSFETTVSSTAGLKLHAVYPFLVATEETSAAAPRRMMAKEGEETAAIPAGLSLMTMRTSKDASIEFGGRTISSIDGINAARSMTDETERYYTIGGVALSSRPSLPGIYVAVKGSSVKKVVIK